MSLRSTVLASGLAVVAATAAVADNGLGTKQSAFAAEETLSRLSSAMTEAGFTVFATLDHAAAAQSAELEMPFSTVLVFGNPKLGTPSFLSTPELAIDLPLKALVWEDAAGDVFVSYNSGTYVHETLYNRHASAFDPEVTQRINAGLGKITDGVVN